MKREELNNQIGCNLLGRLRYIDILLDEGNIDDARACLQEVIHFVGGACDD
jgi:soluble cytochrome b562